MEVLRGRQRGIDMGAHRVQAGYEGSLAHLVGYWRRECSRREVTIFNQRTQIEILEKMRADDALLHQDQMEEQKWAQELQGFAGFGNFIAAHTDNDELQEEIKLLKEKIDHLKDVQDIIVTDCVSAEKKQAELEKEKSSWAVEKAQIMAKMSKMEAEATASNAVIAQLKAENEAHKAVALQSTASLALAEIKTWNAESSNLTAMEQAKLSLRDELVFEEMASGYRKRRAEERKEERASKRQRR